MKFQYEAVNADGKLIKGEIEAEVEIEALRQLSNQGLIVADLEAQETKIKRLQRKLTQKDILLAFHELTTLLDSGVSIADAVDSQAHATHHAELNRIFASLSWSLRKGESLSQALKQSKLKLPDYMFNLIEAGEMTGKLGYSLRQGVAQMEYEQKLSTEMRNALVYPSILVCSGIGAVLLMFIFVVPKFSNLLKDSEDLPFLAYAVLNIGMWFNKYATEIGVIGIVATVLAVYLFRQPQVQTATMSFLSRMPLIGDWLAESDTARWASVMAAMLSSKVDLLRSLELAVRGVKITARESKLRQVIKGVKAGQTLSKSLEENSALTPTGYNLIRVGEKSGKLPEMLASLAKLYDESSRARMKSVLIMIEPLSILIIGGVIGTIITGIILAITSVNDMAM